MSTLVPNQESAGPVTSVVFFVLLFLSGLWFPLKANRGWRSFRTTFRCTTSSKRWPPPFNLQPGVSVWAWHDLLVVAIWGVAAFVVALRKFRWAPSTELILHNQT